MKTLRSYVSGAWHEADGGFVSLIDPCSEEPLARASTRGIDFAAATEHARRRGGPALGELDFGARGALLAAMSRALQGVRDELIELSLRNTGSTRKDAKFDVDGGIFTLAHYGELGAGLGARRSLQDGAGVQLGRSPRFWGQHVLVPRTGVAVLVNAFNFPVWGFAEKAATALLAGVPAIVKPATSSALVAERAFEAVVAAGILPAGALSLVCGSTGDLLDRLGGEDVLAFTGSASTALALRAKANLLAAGTRVNIEADSLNAAILGPDADPGEETWAAFVADVTREMTQKTGQKCTAVRRILIPLPALAAAEQALVEALSTTVVGNPAEPSVTMGPLATRSQLDDALAGIAKLRGEAALVRGSGERTDGAGNPPGKGFFLAPTLLRASGAGRVVHEHEVFGPVATIVGYDGSAAAAADLVRRGGGSLVTSIYSDDREFLAAYLARGGATSGRLYVGSKKVASQLPGSGLALPQMLHGGPGRAGGGEELGGLRGLGLYLQRVALTGDRAIVEHLADFRREGGGDADA